MTEDSPSCPLPIGEREGTRPATPGGEGEGQPQTPPLAQRSTTSTRSATGQPQTIPLALAAIVLLAVAVPTWVVTHPPRMPPPATKRVADLARRPRRVVPPAELPPVEPVALVDLTPEEARAYNATVPFSTGPNPAARPFRFVGDAEARARAQDCLAAGVIYEAGDDAIGERAVAQVILNRLRHPAFPKTVCGVVFEGAERTTGCQFTFSCDGALTRWTPTEAAWRRAREIAGLALSGAVFKPVGYATHYHTDWVVPYWQASLDKIAAVGSHLFFRWSGWWGTPVAFNRSQSGTEAVVQQLAALSEAHRTGAALDDAAGSAAMAKALLASDAVADPAASAIEGQPASFIVPIDWHDSPDSFVQVAQRTCGDRPRCSVMGWARASLAPKSLPATADQIATMSFSYLRDRAAGIDKPLWNCTEFKRPDRAQCMKQQVLLSGPPTPAATPTPQPAPTRVATTAKLPDDPTGLRARTTPAPATPR